MREQVEERKSYAARKKRAEAAGKVPRDLREKVKKTPGVKSWLRALEEPVRQFLVEQGIADEKESEVEDSEDDEIVFVGRNVSSMANGGGKQDSWRRAHIEVCEKSVDTGMVFDSLEDDESGAFKYAPFPSPLMLLLRKQLTRCRKAMALAFHLRFLWP